MREFNGVKIPVDKSAIVRQAPWNHRDVMLPSIAVWSPGIGFSTVSNIVVRKAKSRLRGSTEALCVSAKYQQCRFDFVFTSLVNDSPRIFTTVKEVLK